MTDTTYHQATNTTHDKLGTLDTQEITPSGRSGIELLRVFAIVLLVFYHAVCLTTDGQSGPLSWLAFHLGQAGFVGTDLLLALAGFLAVGSRARAASAGAWLLRRWLRAFPALAAFLLLYLYGVPYGLAALGVRAEDLPTYSSLDMARARQWTMWTMTSNFLMVTGYRMGAALEPLLTLGVGAQITLLAAWLLPSFRRLFFGIGIVAIIGVSLRALWLHADRYLPYSFPLTRADGFLLGAGFATLLRSRHWRDWLLSIRHRLLLATTVLLLGIMAGSRGMSLDSSLLKTLGYPAISLWAASLVLFFSQLSSCPRLLRWISRAGRGAYFAYLVKLPVTFVVLWALQRSGRSGFFAFVLLSLGASWLVGLLGYLVLERPMGRLLGARRRAPRLPVSYGG